MQEYNITEIAEIVLGKVSIRSAQVIISDLVTDSRKLNSPASSMFFALVTQRNDGHKYIETLAKQGVKNFCVNKIPPEQNYEANFIVVDNTLEALQKLTAWYRSQFNIPVVGITGSNGKTIVKEWLWQLMSEEKTIVRSPKSYNSQIGVPLSVWQISPLHNLAVFEAGISQPGEMAKLYEIIKPTIGIITNIGKAHDQFFESHDQKTREKLLLFQRANTVIYNRDAELIHKQLVSREVFEGYVPSLFSWGSSTESSLQITEIRRDKRSTTIKSVYQDTEHDITIRFTDEASIENAIHCWATMLVFGYGPEVIRNRMLKLQSVAMRLEMKEGINGCIIINDTYSSDPDSLANALDFLNQQAGYEKKTVILSDMLQSSTNSDLLYRSIAKLLSQKKINRLIGIGAEMQLNRELFPMQKQFFDSTDEFISRFNQLHFRNESILIKGARMFEFERINELLQQKSHETILEVNLNALVHNLNYFRSIVKPSTKIMVMVKAFSYGSGSFEIANTLQFHHADYLAVAYADEGIELRKAGISLPIMVMNPEISGMESLIRYHLEPEVYSFRTLDNLAQAIDNLNGAVEYPINIHIKLDTGMHRLGFMEEDIDKLTDQLKSHPQIKVASVFSHLAASEAKDLDWFTTAQISNFERMAWNIKDNLGYSFMRHILNSAGIIRHPYAQFEMVRLGISLYGISPLVSIQKKLEIVSSLKTVISQVKTITEGEAVGYNCKWVAQNDSTIAIVPVGYADGLGRKLGNGVGCMYVKGKLVPIIGNINMDMTILDITGVEAEEGDEVIVFGQEISLNKVAEQMETIPYEILTGISRRVKRIYFQE